MLPNNLALSLIVAMTPEGIIGRDNSIPWRLPSDMKRFKETTIQEGVVIMGRKTWESLPEKFRPLPERHNIVLTRDCSQRLSPSLEMVSSVEEACLAAAAHGRRACIIGGSEIYALFLSLVQTAYITTVHARIDGDACFPDMRRASWRCDDKSPVRRWHLNDEYQTSFSTLTRVQ